MAKRLFLTAIVAGLLAVTLLPDRGLSQVVDKVMLQLKWVI